MAFFSSWQTWVKLTFVLGCAICIVFTYAIGVRYSNKKKLNNHAIRIATEITERGEMTEAVRCGEEVPFGIRAIERGCIVEGVWNSKATTPLLTPNSSKAGSPILKATKRTLKKHKRDSSLSNVSRLDIPEPALMIPEVRELGFSVPNILPENIETTAGHQIAEGMMEGTHKVYPHLADGPGPALYNEQPVAAKSYGLPQSQSGPQVGPSRTSTAKEPREQLHPDDSASQISSIHQDVSSSKKWPSHMRCLLDEKEMETPPSQQRIKMLSKDTRTIEYMNAHRRYQAAETGQLIPRERRQGGSRDISTGLNISLSETGIDHSAARSVSWPMSITDSYENNTIPSNPSLLPKLEDLPIRVLAKRLPLPPLRHAGSHSKEASIQLRDHGPLMQSECASLLESQPRRQSSLSSFCMKGQVATSVPCPSSWTDRLQDRLVEIQIEQQKAAKVQLTDAVLSHHNKTARQINSGFALFPSGALSMPTPVKQWGDAAPARVDISNEAQVSRKPKKRDCPHSRSRRSSSKHESHGKENIQ